MSTPTPPDRSAPDDDLQRMAPIYTAVVIVQLLVLLGLWWFQQHFS